VAEQQEFAMNDPESTSDPTEPEAQLAQFHEGEEPYTDSRVVPTPAQWIWKWNRATPARRLRMAEAILGAQETAQQCVIADHKGAVEELRAADAAIYRIRCIADIRAIAAPLPDSYPAGYRAAMRRVMEIIHEEAP
jgi:hypothetical protein